MENIVFYLLNINTKESYSKFHEYIDYLNKYNISAYQNQFFQYEAMGLDFGQLVYISIENEDVFLEILDKCKIEAEKKARYEAIKEEKYASGEWKRPKA